MVRDSLIVVGFALFSLPNIAFAQNPGMRLESEVTPAEVYVQEQAVLTLRLLKSGPFAQGELLLPEIPNVVVEYLDEDEDREIQREETTYWQRQRRYLLFPQRSGSLALPAPIYSGRNAYVRGEPPKLRVRPRPGEAQSGHWLPAQELTMSQEWRTPPQPWRIGDQLERIIVLEAKGLTGAQLPVMPLPALKGLDSMRLRSRIDNRFSREGVRGRRIEQHLFVARQAEAFVIPDLSLQWWNLDSDRSETKVLLGRTMEIRPVPSAGLDMTNQATGEPILGVAEEAAGDQGKIAWVNLTIGGLIFTMLVLVAAGTWSWRLFRLDSRLRRAWQIYLQKRCFERACRANDAPGIYQALRRWCALQSGLPEGRMTTSYMAGFFHDVGSKKALWILDRFLFGDGAANWQGEGIWRRLEPQLKYKKQPGGFIKSNPLPDLNP